jgi:kanamycin nucleotidyltransferase
MPPVDSRRVVADPRPQTREARLGLAAEVAGRLKEVHGVWLKAVGVYGSTARGTDGPYSDLEMWCVLRTSGEEYAHEWTHGPWKAEVDVSSADVLLAEAARVEGTWPLTHGSFQVVLPLFDPDRFFDELRREATSQPETRFREALRAVVVGELYEDIAKVRNALAAGHAAALPQEAVEIATYGAYAIGLANRRCFTSGVRKFEEALRLPDRPDGYEPLARLVMAGTLSDARIVAKACERFWQGLVTWVGRRGIALVEPRRLPF